MIRTSVSFSSTDKRLERLYTRAKDTILASIKSFGNRKLLTDAPNSDVITLNYSVLTAETLADYDTEIATDCVRAFLVTLRKDGRPASALKRKGGSFIPSYEALTGFSFAEEAVKMCYLVKNKKSSYSKRLYSSLCQFDEYLWTRHDLNANGCLEIFEERDTEEGVGAGRFAPLTMIINGSKRSVSPFPIEVFDLMGEAFCIRTSLAEVADMLGKQDEAASWRQKAELIAEKISTFFWLNNSTACFDRDYRGSVINNLSIHNLWLLYYGVFGQKMAESFLDSHLLNPREFWTPMPLPSVTPNDSLFDSENPFRGHPRAITYRRAIPALERYGYYAALTELGQKLLRATSEQGCFPPSFDYTTGKALGEEAEREYAPTASAVLEIIKRFFGVYADRETVCWGCLGCENESLEYSFTWGNDTYHVENADGVATGSINGQRIFTVTAGTRIFTDVYGTSMRVINATDKTLDCICVCRGKTHSMCLAPNESISLD